MLDGAGFAVGELYLDFLAARAGVGAGAIVFGRNGRMARWFVFGLGLGFLELAVTFRVTEMVVGRG